MRLKFMPKTLLGKWSVGFILAFFLSFTILQLLIFSGQRGGAEFFTNLILAIPGLLAAIFAIFSFFTGIIGILIKKDHSIFVILATIIGFFILIFCLCEILFPH